MYGPDLRKGRPGPARSRANFLLTEVDDCAAASFCAVVEGLKGRPKKIPCKYLYDEEGSRLFDLICELPEYYLTRTELAILDRNIGSIMGRLGTGICIIEPGAGSCLKARFLLGSGNTRSFIPSTSRLSI
jgi:uncharacterized SAM-dependent methyltransferase